MGNIYIYSFIFVARLVLDSIIFRLGLLVWNTQERNSLSASDSTLTVYQQSPKRHTLPKEYYECDGAVWFVGAQ